MFSKKPTTSPEEDGDEFTPLTPTSRRNKNHKEQKNENLNFTFDHIPSREFVHDGFVENPGNIGMHAIPLGTSGIDVGILRKFAWAMVYVEVFIVLSAVCARDFRMLTRARRSSC